MRAADLATASILMLLGGVVVFDSLRIGIGWGTDGPRAGFFPFWLGAILIFASVTIGVQAWRRTTDRPFVTRSQLGPVLKVLWPATLMVVLITPLGLYVAAALYLGFYMRWVGRHGWLAVVLCAIGVPLVTFAVFELWFLVPMPKGPLEAWLGY
ncbi:MAG TPA: tripartite tricarboxylate transporter TctB family protein [Methylomirabilota bacterium]|nr:tripartite tricarboxylate transporter TctB family protein [Methylomirabilota bacterium]